MAGTTGLEPATSAVTGQRSNQLSYVPEFGTGETSRYWVSKPAGISGVARLENYSRRDAELHRLRIASCEHIRTSSQERCNGKPTPSCHEVRRVDVHLDG